MENIFETRYSSAPKHVKKYDTQELRDDFLIDGLMTENKIKLVYSFFDRMIVAGIVPLDKPASMPVLPLQKSEFFTERRETGIINLGGPGKVLAEKNEYPLNYKDALYLGKGNRAISFISDQPEKPAKFYINAALAHKQLPDKIIKREEANAVVLGSDPEANSRTLYQYIVPNNVETCQLMMGITQVDRGSVWNTMPCHTHELRMEVYFYFEVPENQAVCHYMGTPDETRHIWVHNEQAVISPPWSIHSASGTANYNFIWGMAGSDSEMDHIATKSLR